MTAAPSGSLGADDFRSHDLSAPPALPAVFLMTDSFATGGSERQFVTLAAALNREHFQVRLGCIQKTGAFLAGFEEAVQFPLGGSMYGAESWRMRLRLGGYLHRNHIQIAHAFDFYTNVMLAPVARMAGVPIVIGSQRQLGDLLTSTKAKAQLLAFRFCDRIVCNSQAAANGLAEQGIGRRRLVVIGNGLTAAAFVPAQPALSRQAGVLRVGMVARMNSFAKNHKLFLEAAASIAPRMPKVQFVLVGDGPLRSQLETYAQRLGLGSKVVFLGDRRDIPSVLASLDISVLPSESESLSNAILESMAAAVPVIAADVGGNRELLAGGRGVLVQAGNANAVGASLQGLLLDYDLRRTMGDNAKKFALDNFTVAHMQRKHEQLYEDLLAEKGWHPEAVSRSFPRRVDGKVRVAIVAASLRYVGGQSVQAELLRKNWEEDPAVDVRLIAIDPPFPTVLRWADAIPGLRTILRLPLYLRDLWYGLKDVDIAHIFSASYWSFLIAPVPAWFIARVRRARVLIHYHSGEARDHLQRHPSARFALARVDRLVVPTGFLVSVFREFGLDAEAVPNVIDLSRFHFRVRRPLCPRLVCTRGFHPYYSVDVVVRAFAEVKKVYADAQLDLVGGGPLENQVRSLVDELKLSGVKFSGVVPREEIAQCYDRADIFINASNLDNMPVSVLEAFASGTPVISTSPEGMNYLVEDGRTGLLSTPGDAQALARNVIRILDEPEIAWRLANNAFAQSKLYDWSVVREQWLKVYRSLHGDIGPISPPPAKKEVEPSVQVVGGAT